MNNDLTMTEPNTSRRSFVRTAVAAAAVTGISFFASEATLAQSATTLTFADIPGSGDVKVLNYALALEALEADLYVQAYLRLTGGGTNALGTRIPGLGLRRSQPDVYYLREFANIELQHRRFIDRALGSASLLRQAPFNNARFNFGIENMTRQQVLNLIYTAERTGVAAYLGAIPFFQTRTFLQTAGAIQGTEARHTTTIAIIQNILFGSGISTAPLADENNGIDDSSSPNAVLEAIRGFIVL